MTKDLINRITYHLSSGGLFNPELADHLAVRNLLMECREALAQPEQEPVAWKYDVTHNQDGTVSVALPDGDELRIVLPNQQEPYCWTWDEFVSGGKWRAEYGWKKPTKKVVNLQPLYTTPPQRKWVGLTDEELPPLAGDNGKYMELQQVRRFYKAIEAKLKEKNT